MSVALKENLKKNFAEVFEDLPVEMLAEVIDFAEFLREKERRKKAEEEPETKPKGKRVFGLHQGQGWISDDFNDELGDEFWFGEDFGIIKKDDESAA